MKINDLVKVGALVDHSEYLNTSTGPVTLGRLAHPITYAVWNGFEMVAVFDHHPTVEEVEDAVRPDEVREEAPEPKAGKGKAVEEEADSEPEEVSDGEESE